MSIVALFSDKGSPGVTTLAFALSSAWPQPAVLVELDPAGGDLGLRLTDPTGRPVLAADPGLLTLAASARHDAATHVSGHAQPAALAQVVSGLVHPRQARGMAELWPSVVTALRASRDVDVIADLGRLTSDSPVAEIVSQADVALGVARAEPAAMLRLRDRLLDVHEQHAPPRLMVALIAEDRHAREAADAMQRVLADGQVPAQLAGIVSFDPRAITSLLSGQGGPRLQRSTFMRSVGDLVHALVRTGRPLVAVPSPRRRLVRSR
jgi:hypothetical protein